MRYTIVAEAIDTDRFDSRIAAFARDPLDPGRERLTFAGLEPISVPEPGAGACCSGSRRGDGVSAAAAPCAAAT